MHSKGHATPAYYLHKNRFRLLALLLCFYLVVPPLIGFPTLTFVKDIVLKIMLITVGARFFDRGHTRMFYYVIGMLNLLLAGGNFIIDEGNAYVFLAEYLTLVVMVSSVFYKLMVQVVGMKDVTFDGILGAFAGYIMLGLVAFLMYMSLQLLPGETFTNLGAGQEKFERLFYYAFVSITTIGFGDIVPVHPYAQKLTIFFGILGQFYLAVNVAILVSKYLRGRD
jgi:hypothetical protein